MNQVKCVVVEDEALARELLKNMILDDSELLLAGEADNGQDACTLIQQTQPELLFLDVEMPGLSGLEVLEALRFEGVPVPTTIFVTAYDKYALKAFEAHAVDYLLKPFDEARFQHAVKAAKARARAEKALKHGANPDSGMDKLLVSMRNPKIAVRNQGKITLIRLETIDWVEASGNYLLLHVGKTIHTIRETMNSFAERLTRFPFARIHRSTIVNVNRISNIQPWYTGEYVIRLDTGAELTMTRTYRKNLAGLLGDKVFKGGG
jgi:two-component system, LytTR family, response regulator